MIQDGGTGFSDNQIKCNPENATTVFCRLSVEQQFGKHEMLLLQFIKT